MPFRHVHENKMSAHRTTCFTLAPFQSRSGLFFNSLSVSLSWLYGDISVLVKRNKTTLFSRELAFVPGLAFSVRLCCAGGGRYRRVAMTSPSSSNSSSSTADSFARGGSGGPRQLPAFASPPGIPFSPADAYAKNAEGAKKLVPRRPVPLGDSPTFTDIADILDALMAPGELPATTSVSHTHAPWNGQRAVVLSGRDVVSFLLRASFAKDHSHAKDIGYALVRAGGLLPMFTVREAESVFVADGSVVYVHRGLTSLKEHGLNAVIPFPARPRPRPATDVLLDLCYAFRDVCHVSVSLDGRFVNYAAVRGMPGWRHALVLLAELAVASDDDLASTSDDVKKACFFNLYNLLIFHAKLVLSHPDDLLKRSKFFDTAAYTIAGKLISSGELEHLILRCRISPDDSRASWRLHAKDPRMHFILNCGAQSCPPLRIVYPDNLEQQLNDATCAFIDHQVKVDVQKRQVVVSRLWKWFRKDFTPGSHDDAQLLTWIAAHASKNVRADLDKLMERDYNLKFDVYNWADNGNPNAKPDVHFMPIYDLSFARTA